MSLNLDYCEYCHAIIVVNETEKRYVCNHSACYSKAFPDDFDYLISTIVDKQIKEKEE